MADCVPSRAEAPIRVALIGYGFGGRVFHAPLISTTPDLTLAVVGSRQGDAVRLVYPDAEVVSDPLAAARHPAVDLVVIATPNDTHAPLAEAALAAGKHVVVDKPFTLTLAEARALAVLAAEADRRLSVFQNRRWDSDFLGVSRELAAGRVGRVVEVRSEMSRYRPEVRDRWRERAGPGSGLWFDLGPHLIDQALVLFGVPDGVYADLRIQRGGTTVDWFQTTLGYGPMRVILTSSMLATDPVPRFLVRGTAGSITKRGADRQEEQLLRGEKPGAPGWGSDPDPVRISLSKDGPIQERPAPPGDYPQYYAAIRDAVRGTGALPVTPAEATAVMAVIEAGIQSAAEGRVIGPGFTDAELGAWRPVISPSAPGTG